MRVLIEIFSLAGNLVVYIMDILEPDLKDPFWEES